VQALALHAQLPLGQRHDAALCAVPQHRPALAATLLDAGELLRRQHKQLVGQRNGSLVDQFVDARLRTFEPFKHRQQRLATASQHTFCLRPVVAMHDLQSSLCFRILHGGFLVDGFSSASSLLSNSPGNRDLKFQLRLGHHLCLEIHWLCNRTNPNEAASLMADSSTTSLQTR